ncbi:MAG: hypothetical protein V4629_03120 [Pseudomonadota bacterium]
MLDLLASAAGGGILGTIGALSKAGLEFVGKKEENAHQLKMREIDLRHFDKQIEKARVEGETGKEIALINAREASLQASFESDKATYGNQYIDAIRGLMRPLITCYLLIQQTSISYKLFTAGAEIPPELFAEAINSTVFLTTTAVTWWFGSRSSQ